ncbi:helix-turn-helix transcriptional regulator [Brucella sp. TWI432]
MNTVNGETTMEDTKRMKSGDTPGERLRKARYSYGFASASDAARRLGVKVPTYTSHENNTRSYTADEAVFYGETFKVNPVWLIFGSDYASPGRDTIETRPRRSPKSIAVKNEPKALALESIPTGDWRVPDRFLSEHLGVDVESARIVQCVGGSSDVAGPLGDFNFSSLENGDRLIVDVSDKIPEPLALFIVREGDNLLFRELRYVGKDADGIVDVGSPFSARANYTIDLSTIEIFGRIKGRFSKI